jgi:dipeptidyl aminopeptidase/acylaminoacyl peptidase
VDLIVMPAGGGEEKNLTADWDYLPSGSQWSSDGKYVYFTGGIGGTTHLFRVAPDGGAVEQVTKGERRIGGLSFDRALTKMAFTVGRFEAPSEISIANIDGTGERQLTHIFDPLLAEIELSKAERLNFKSADGTPVEGWLLYPFGYRPGGGPYPLIVSNHGGPHSAVGYGFDFKSQYFAANGYFVLQVNFRSSTGYGEKFLWATWGAWGTKDGQDVMAGVDLVIKNFPVSANRVATIGHSYGGFMSNWLITQYPDRFAAACPGAGISNWISDYGLADIARTKETEFYGAPWDPRAREIMIRQSPLTYANRVKAATLFIHGEVDHRVPFEEGEQMYFALKKNGVPAKIIQYAGQPHGIAGNWNQVHRMLNERAWLDTYLKGSKAK